MADMTIGFFGSYINPKENSDKVWGWINVEGTPYTFWAKRGARMNFKHHESFESARNQARQKAKKGYREVFDPDEIERLYPDFNKICQRHLFNAKMRGKVISEG